MRLDLTPDGLLTAYVNGVFPMADEDGTVFWLAPDPRAIIDLDAFRPARSLRAVVRRGVYAVTVNRAFRDVIDACAGRSAGTWISSEIREAYCRLHDLGFGHSVEAWHEGELAGGLYGVSVGGAFFGESMFFRRTDASKVALVALVRRMKERGLVLLDVQFMTGHLESLGAVEIPRSAYLRRLRAAVQLSCSFADPAGS